MTRALPSRLPVLLPLALATVAAWVGAEAALEYRVFLRVVQGPAAWALLLLVLAGSALGPVAIAREIAAIRRVEPRARAFAALRSLVVAAVVSWIALLFLVESAERLWTELALGAGASLWIVWIALEGPSPRRATGLRKAAGVVLFALAASALLAELALRAWAGVRPSPLFARLGDTANVALERMRQPPGTIRFGFPCNSGGHYDEEFRRRAPGERLVATIGDSFSLSAVPHAYHFTTVCERELGVPVDNLGVAAVGPPEYRRMLVDEALWLDPDVVVIDLFVGNDFRFGVQMSEGSRALAESWIERENVLLWVVPRRLARIAAERRRRGREGGGVAALQGESDALRGSVEATFPWVADPKLEKPTFTEPAFLALEVSRAVDASRLSPAQLTDLHDVLLEMKRVAAPRTLCVMIIPDEYQIEDALWDRVVREAGSQALDRDRPQELLVPWLAANGIPCLDLAPVLGAVPPMEDGNRHLYQLRDSHWNARGNAVAGRALAEFLAPLLRDAGGR